jgi:hypothetical protein
MRRHIFSLVVLMIAILFWILIFKLSASPSEPQISPQEAEPTQTPILGEAKYTLDEVKAWAKSRGASDDFISAADIYYEIGKSMGIRPDVLYAQSAKETAFGNYGGNVTADMFNFAGIKTASASGDTREDHQTFASIREGIGAHFNHMAAYVGLEPIGETHERYFAVKTAAWAGSIKFVEELGGHWAPAKDYGNSIVSDYLNTIS